jgi:hypothetical protein
MIGSFSAKLQDMSATIKLRHNVIFGGKYYPAGEPIERSILPFAMRKYEVKEEEEEEKPSSRREINLRREYNKLYLVEDGKMTVPVRQQAAQLMAEAQYQDYVDEESNRPLDPDTQAALDEAQKLYRSDLEARKLQMKVAAENAEALSDAIREEQDQAVAEGAYDQMDVPFEPPPAKVKMSEPPSAAKMIGGQKLFVKRGKGFVPAHEVDDLEQGEPLYRFRPRSLGQTAMYIRHSEVR